MIRMLTRPPVTGITIYWNGKPIQARPDDSIAVALLAAGINTTRATTISGAPRGPYCMMGACFECLAEVDGRPNTQTCMTQVKDGMQVRPQAGAPRLPPPGRDLPISETRPRPAQARPPSP